MAVDWVDNVQIHIVLSSSVEFALDDITGRPVTHNIWVCVLRNSWLSQRGGTQSIR